MSYLDDQKTRMLGASNSSNIRTDFVNSFLENIINTFEYSPSYYQVTKNLDMVTKYDCWIQEVKNSPKDAIDKKNIIMKPNQTIEIGETINWMGKVWLTVDKETSPFYDNAQIYKCNNILKWYDSYNKLISVPSITTNEMNGTSLGINEGKVTTVEGVLKIILPDTEDTRTIQEGQRFIYKNRFAYKVTFIDLSIDGLVRLSLEQVEKNESIDNLELGIADYYNRPAYLVQITEDDISIVKNSNLQLHAVVTKNGIVVNEEIEWVSSNLSVASISNSGMLSTIISGDTNITAKLKGNDSYSDTILCNVRNVPVSNIDIVLDGDSSIEWTTSKTYTAKKLINGVTQTASFNFTIDYNGNPSSIVSMVVNGINNVTLTANSNQVEGIIKLKATNKLNANEYIIKNIQIKGYW